jgi:ferredoxin
MVTVDQKTCIGCGACAAVCEDVFEMKDGKSHVKKGKEKSSTPCAKEAVEVCPVNAINA